MKISQLSDEEFMRLLQAERRAQIQELQAYLDRERKDCLWITRAQELANDPAATTTEEQAHLDRCALCRRAISRFRELQLVTNPAPLNGTPILPVLAFPDPLPLLQLAAKTARIDESGNDAGLDWRLVEDGGDLLFRVNSTDQKLAGRHVAFTLHGGEGTSVGGVLTLQPDEAGYFVGSTTFRREELAAALAGECRGIEVKLQSNGTA